MSARVLAAGVAVVLALLASACSSGPRLTAEEVSSRVIELTQAEDRSYHIDVLGASRYVEGGHVVNTSIEAAFDCLAGDCSGRVRTGLDRVHDQATVVVLGTEIFWQSADGQGWRHTFGSAPAVDPLRRLSLDDLEYMGLEDTENGLLHRFNVLNTPRVFSNVIGGFGVGGDPTGIQLFDSAGASVELYVDATGEPVALVLTMLSASFEHQAAAEMRYEFSRWGEPFVIAAPE